MIYDVVIVGAGVSGSFIAERLAGREPSLPPPTTAHGGLIAHLGRHPEDYQPSNITFSHVAPWEPRTLPNGKLERLAKRAKYEAMAERALADLGSWLDGAAPRPVSAPLAAHPAE